MQVADTPSPIICGEQEGAAPRLALRAGEPEDAVPLQALRPGQQEVQRHCGRC